MNELKTKNDTPAEEARPKQSRWRRLPKGGRAAVVALGIVVLLAVTAFLYVNGKLDLLRYNDGSVSEMGEIGAEEDQDLDGTGLTHTEADMAVPEGSPFADEDVLNILLIGTDERTEAVNDADAFTHLNQLDGTEDTTEFSDDARADSMILVSMDIKDHVIRLVSIERGTGVPILLDGYEDQYDWITHTFRYGGPKLTMKTVEECYNIEVDHFVRVNFNSFVQIVNAVGGVDIDITEMEAKALNWEVPSNSMLIVNHVDPGLNHFDGYTALQYARLRKIDNDWKRVERQRTVIKAVLDQVKNASVMELDNLLNTILPLIQTNFTKSEIAALLVQLPGFLGCDVQQMSMPLQGICQGGQPLMSFNFGAGKTDRVKQAFRLQFGFCVALAVLFWVVSMLAPQVLAGIFTTDPELVSYTAWAMRIYMAGIFSCGFQRSCQQSFVALGQAKISLFMACLRKLILLIPLILILPHCMPDKVFAVFLAEPVSDIIAAAVTSIAFFTRFNKILAGAPKSNTQPM